MIQPPKVKVCGLTNLTEIQDLINLGVHYLGFIFYEASLRYVLNHLSLEDIANIHHEAKVGVFVNHPLDEVVDIATQAELSAIQAHGDEHLEDLQYLRAHLPPQTKIIKVVRVGEQLPNLEAYLHTDVIDYLLFDTDSALFGGTGQAFDWKCLNEVHLTKPYVLSGGINGDQLPKLSLLRQQPTVLDINSKFETAPGRKNLAQIKDFLYQLGYSAS